LSLLLALGLTGEMAAAGKEKLYESGQCI